MNKHLRMFTEHIIGCIMPPVFEYISFESPDHQYKIETGGSETKSSFYDFWTKKYKQHIIHGACGNCRNLIVICIDGVAF